MADLDDFIASHAELRGAVVFARKRIRALGGEDDPALAVLDRALDQARRDARGFGEVLLAQSETLLDEGEPVEDWETDLARQPGAPR